MPLFWEGRFSLNNEYLVIDNAHTDDVYEKWLGPHAADLPLLKLNSEVVCKEDFLARVEAEGSIWQIPSGDEE
jgi:hypothetical protein